VASSVDLRALLERPVLEVAPQLLGAVLRHDDVACRLTEVEAYDGANDPGSHAYRGPTPRNQVMFGPPGHLYVYFTYGMHWCANIVCGPEGRASAVLLRAGEIMTGLETARSRRLSARTDRDLARGPARLCRALGIAREQNGHDLARARRPACRVDRDLARGPARLASALGIDQALNDAAVGGPRSSSQVRLRLPADVVGQVRSGPRVGVSGAGGDGLRYPWRFWLDEEPTVSTYRRAPSRRQPPRTGAP
jgi:DNA-3-methyladenine glycosylase